MAKIVQLHLNKESKDPELLDLMNEFILYNNQNLYDQDLHKLDEPTSNTDLLNDWYDALTEQVTFGAYAEGKLIGFVSAIIKDKKYKILNKLGIIEELFISKNFRGKGIASQLFKKIEDHLIEQGCNRLSIEAYATNHNAIEIYKNWGFKNHLVTLYKIPLTN